MYSWIFGILSNCVWVFVLIPQFLTNMRIQSTHAVSFYLVFCWLYGDLLSILSATALNLHPVIILTGFIHVIFDFAFLFQWFYYKTHTYSYTVLSHQEPWYSKIKVEGLVTVAMSFLVIAVQYIIQSTRNEVFIILIGWLSTILFLVSRVPQIYLNYQRKSTFGLSLTTFVLLCIANIFFFLSVELGVEDLNKNLQWIVGSSGSFVFDLIIFSQFYMYRLDPDLL